MKNIHLFGVLYKILRFIGKFTKFENLEGDSFNFSPSANGQNKPAGGPATTRTPTASTPSATTAD
ncbi:MAG: hypothetical protein EAZ95_15045 [Bacteroidetes bacterium]|nr:MAG: hypothetical protein EAZ95_15045 [Bacteroidota bacterium]